VSTPRKGFTLIELMIVCVIIGILAGLAIPKFQRTKSKAYAATMKSDLHNLAAAQEGYFTEKRTYFTGTVTNDGTGTITPIGEGYKPSSGVTVTTTGDIGGWSAEASMPSVTTRTCAIFINVAPAAPYKTQGAPECTP